MNSYWLYGLRLASNEPLTCLTPADPGQPDVSVSFHSATSADSVWCQGEGSPWHPEAERRGLRVRLNSHEERYEFEYWDRTRFRVNVRGDSVGALTPPGARIEDTLIYLVGPVMGFVLRVRGVVSLHASAVLVGNKAVCVCGGPGAGKSSTAAAMALRGYPILTEDVAPLDDGEGALAVRPGYPRVNLWGESSSALFGSTEALPVITPNWDKRYMPLGDGFWQKTAPLAAVYVITARHQGRDAIISERPPSESFVALVANTYVNYLLDRSMRAHEFDVLSRLIRTVPVRFVSPPADIGRIGALCDALEADVTQPPE